MIRRYWHFGLLLSALVAGCTRPPPDSAQEAVKVVATAPLRLPVVEWDEYIGRIDPIEEVEVRARVSGHLESTHFVEGQIVQKGDWLSILDHLPFRIPVEQLEPDLAAPPPQAQVP